MDPALLLFAFSAGAAAFFAPCCVAMLPAYIAYAVRAPTAAYHNAPPGGAPPLARALTLIALLPILGGTLPLLARGLGSLRLVPDSLYPYLPSIELSLSALLMGGGLLMVALLLAGRARSALRGLLFGGLATAGSFAAFVAVGVPVAFLSRGLTPYLTYLSAAIGLGLVVLGVLMLLNRPLSPRIPALRMDVTHPSGFFKFGVGYGVAGLSCTFPVFLAVVGAGAIAGGFTAALLTFLAYATGKASILAAVTVATVAGGEDIGARLQSHSRVITRTSAIMLLLAGGYIAWYFGRFAFIP